MNEKLKATKRHSMKAFKLKAMAAMRTLACVQKKVKIFQHEKDFVFGLFHPISLDIFIIPKREKLLFFSTPVHQVLAAS